MTAPLPQIEPASTVKVITGFIRSQLEQTGFRRLVVGLAGGVDSATVAFLGRAGSRPGQPLAVRMPYRSPHPSRGRCPRVVEALGLPHRPVDITPMVDPMLATMDDPERTRPADC